MNNAHVGIVVVHYGDIGDTKECIESIFKSDYKKFSLVVVNNTKTIPLKDSLNLPYEIDFIEPKENLGFAKAVNLGIKFFLGFKDIQYVWVLNNDVVVFKNSLKELVIFFEKLKKDNHKLALIGTVQMYYNNPSKIQAAAGGFNKWKAKFWNYDNLFFNENQISYIYGASMLFDINVFKDVGLFSEDYFLYYEEIDFCERLKKAGYSYTVAKHISILHKHGASISKIGGSRKYYLERNKIIFFKKFYPYLVFIPVLKLIYKIIFKSRNKKIYLKAFIDGLKWKM